MIDLIIADFPSFASIQRKSRQK